MMKNKLKTCFVLGIFWVFIGLNLHFVEAQQNNQQSEELNQLNGLAPSNELTPSSKVLNQSNESSQPFVQPNQLSQTNGTVTMSGVNTDSASLEEQSQKNSVSSESDRSVSLPNYSEESNLSETANSSGLTNILNDSQQLFRHDGIQSSLGIVILITILSLAPAILIMTTSFVRIMTILSILREAIGAGQLPPNQVLTALSLFLTLLIMTPVWTQVYNNAIVPYSNQQIDAQKAFDKGILPIRTFMCQQIERRGNGDDIRLFMQYIPEAKMPEFYEDVPLRALLPAFMLSELKTAFLIGFQLFIPFLIIDMIVSGVLVSMGMMMLPPVMISLPFKLMLFVLMDGWTLVVKMILDSFTLLIT